MTETCSPPVEPEQGLRLPGSIVLIEPHRPPDGPRCSPEPNENETTSPLRQSRKHRFEVDSKSVGWLWDVPIGW